MKDWKKEILAIPNILSLLRILLIPVYVCIYLHADQKWEYIIAAVILSLSCITDFLDGWIARKFQMVTNIGKLLDPIADKFTQLCLLGCLSVEYRPLWILLALFIIKESFQLIALLVAYHKGKALKGALFAGKISTAFLFVTFIFIILFHGQISHSLARCITYIDAVFMAAAFYDYVQTYMSHSTMIQDLTE